MINKKHKSWLDQCLKWKEDYDPVKQEHYENKENIHPYYFIRELSKKMTSNDVFVVDCGGNVVVVTTHLKQKKVNVIFLIMEIRLWDFRFQER